MPTYFDLSYSFEPKITTDREDTYESNRTQRIPCKNQSECLQFQQTAFPVDLQSVDCHTQEFYLCGTNHAFLVSTSNTLRPKPFPTYNRNWNFPVTQTNRRDT